MKKSIFLMMAIVALFSSNVFGQDMAKTIKLEQTPEAFTIKELTLSEGTYVFEIVNSGINHDIGFVIAPAGMTDADHHIKEAYVKKTVKEGESGLTNEVKLTKGEYVYFCPLNPTPLYKLTVE